jgi:hypothetical protein
VTTLQAVLIWVTGFAFGLLLIFGNSALADWRSRRWRRRQEKQL